jgi:uncharacterized membrane protein (UPF0127 family)
MARILLIMLVALFTSCGAPAKTDDSSTTQAAATVTSLEGDFERGTLIIESDDGERHEFSVYLATEFEQQRRGLMFVRKMPANVGMLFTYEDNDMHSMWMKNTYIPLDLIFARSDGSVSSIIHDTQPLSRESQGSKEPVSYVLELNAGTSRRLNIGANSRLILDAIND